MMLLPASRSAYRLLHKGAIAMTNIEEVGLRVDVAYLDNAIKEVGKDALELEKRMQSDPVHKLWKKHYGDRMKIDAPGQLGDVVFKLMGCKRNPILRRSNKDEEGKVSNDEIAFEHLLKDIPYLDVYFEARKLRKALSTTLMGFKREVVDGRIHPFFDLHTAESYRSSSSKPNFQNIQVRNKKIAEIVRTCIIPEKGEDFLETDFSAHEVRVSICYHEDPAFRRDSIGGGDMHRDVTMDLYMLSAAELGDISKGSGKDCRYCGKNKFVFPSFYGSYYAQCAPNLWDAIATMKLTTAKGVSLFDHLSKKGIARLGACDPNQDPEKGTFEFHVRAVERAFWEKYPVYAQWKKDWWLLYQEQGGVNTKTGFRMQGYFRRNQILCEAIQGSAFHCLLWSIIEIQKELKKRKMKAKIVNQIHDSSLTSVPRRERDDFVHLAREISVERIAQAWKWITVPLSVEFEVCRGNWFNKSKLEVA